MTDVLRALMIGGAVFALCYAVHICGRMWERAEQARAVALDPNRDQPLDAATLAWMQRPENAWVSAAPMPELATTDYCTGTVFEFTDGNVIFAAPTDADAAAYLICRSAREAVS